MSVSQIASDEARTARIAEIRMIALAELHSRTGEMDHWKYYAELHELKRRPHDIDWLEAVVAWGAIGRIRPARTTGHLARLRARRTKSGQADRFDRFRDLLDAYLLPDRLTNHGYDRQTFAELDHARLWDHVGAHLSALTELGYQVFLNSGTLLGVVRDGRLIDHDDDIDLGLILKATTMRDAAAEWVGLRATLDRLGLIDAENFETSPIYKLTPLGTTQIDLFPAWQESDRFYVYPHTHGDLAAEDVLPLQPCARTGQPLPAHPERMLAVNYGATWQQPDPLFKFPWTRANRTFAEFLREIGA